MQNGKGDSPRNNFSRKFRDNYDQIDWNYGTKRATGEASKSPQEQTRSSPNRDFDEVKESIGWENPRGYQARGCGKNKEDPDELC